MNIHVPALQRSLPDVVAEYDAKTAALTDALATFTQAGEALKMAANVGGEWGDVTIDTGRPYESTLRTCLLKSAWKHVYNGLSIDRIASADDKRRWQHALEKPPAFTLDNIRATFGDYVKDPRGNILRGLAEVFCSLDQSYKSHDKVKIGVAGLPKRAIIENVSGYSSYGRDKVRDMLNAIAAYRGAPLIDHKELEPLDALHSFISKRTGETTIRGLRIKKFGNNNAHVIFDPATLRDVNRALAEFYGDVLPDAAEEKPTQRRTGTAVSKDLQYYPTPSKVVDDVLRNWRFDGKKVLEPSAGCGRFMDALRALGADVTGIEFDAARTAQARRKGHRVMLANFLDTVPVVEYDFVVMNPPFYGKHYAKHVIHAMKFLRPGGTLIAILPITARDHGLLDHLIPKSRWGDSAWRDLPVGSFSESGTNVNTTILSLHCN